MAFSPSIQQKKNSPWRKQKRLKEPNILCFKQVSQAWSFVSTAELWKEVSTLDKTVYKISEDKIWLS